MPRHPFRRRAWRGFLFSDFVLYSFLDSAWYKSSRNMSYPVERCRFSARAITAACVISLWSSVQAQVVATSDFYSAREGTALVVSAPGVLANDSGAHLTATLVNRPAHGTLTLSGNGSFTYTPTNNFTGMDGFTYRASSGTHTWASRPLASWSWPQGNSSTIIFHARPTAA